MLIYLPPQLSHTEDLPTICDMFGEVAPEYFYAGMADVENVYEQHGWLDVEATWQTPHTGQTFNKLVEMTKSGEYEGQTANTYLVGGLMINILTGRGQETEYQSEWSGYRKIALVLGSRMREDFEGRRITSYAYGHAQRVYNRNMEGMHDEIRVWSYYPTERNRKDDHVGSRTVRKHQRRQLSTTA